MKKALIKIGIYAVVLMFVMLWTDYPLAYYLLFLLGISMPFWLSVGMLLVTVGLVFRYVAQTTWLKTVSSYAAVASAAVIAAILAGFFNAYMTQDIRRFQPYAARIEKLLANHVPPLEAYPQRLLDVVRVLDNPPGWYHDGALQRFVRMEADILKAVFDGRMPLGRSTFSSYAAISLMRDRENIGFFHSGMGEWHVSHFIWSYALLRHFKPDDILRLHLYYTPLGELQTFANAAEKCFERPLEELNEDDLLRLIAISYHPGPGYRGRNDVIVSGRGPRNPCANERIERTYARLKARYEKFPKDK